MLFLSQNMGTWHMIIQTQSKVTKGKGNQGIFTWDKVTQSNNIHTITQGKIIIGRVTYG